MIYILEEYVLPIVMVVLFVGLVVWFFASKKGVKKMKYSSFDDILEFKSYSKDHLYDNSNQVLRDKILEYGHDSTLVIDDKNNYHLRGLISFDVYDVLRLYTHYKKFKHVDTSVYIRSDLSVDILVKDEKIKLNIEDKSHKWAPSGLTLSRKYIDFAGSHIASYFYVVSEKELKDLLEKSSNTDF